MQVILFGEKSFYFAMYQIYLGRLETGSNGSLGETIANKREDDPSDEEMQYVIRTLEELYELVCNAIYPRHDEIIN